MIEYSNSEISLIIDEWIHSERDRKILKRRLIDGCCYEPNIDECIQIMLKLFVVYYNNRTINNLQNLLTTMEQVIIELYNTCETDAERTAIIQSIDKLRGL